MRLLCFQAKRFRWKTFERTLPAVPERNVDLVVEEAVVAFVHVEREDVGTERAASVLRQAVKHLKWLANKRQMRVVVLHSFTHLGGDSAEPEAAGLFLATLSERLQSGGYEAHVTPFGYLNEWELSVHGESLAKVWKQI